MTSWFSSINMYNFTGDFNLSDEEFLEKLKENKIQECGKSAMSTKGWDLVLPEDDESFFFKLEDKYLLRFKKEEKVIPSAIVKADLEKEIAKREKETGDKVSASSKKDIKEGIIARMKAQAFVKPSYVDAYFDLGNKKIVVGVGSAKKSEELLSFLRDTIGTLEVELIEPEYDVISTLTDLVLNPDKSDKFSLGHECKLKDLGDQSSITAKDEDLTSDEIREHILQGKQVETLSLVWEKRIRFKLNSKFGISSIKALDTIKQQLQDDLGESIENKLEVFYADRLLMICDFNDLIDHLIDIND